MDVRVFATVAEMGRAAARHGAEGIRAAVAAHDRANIILATGTSQYSMLEALAAEPKIDWSRVTVFHLDEYVGLSDQHPASFRKYLRERFVSRVGKVAAFHAVRGDGPDPAAECRRLGELIRRHPVDVAFIGIGENGHLAFNDPPADFDTEEPYLVVELDEPCRRQQLGEGWFASLADVPRRAISMSIRQILKAREILCVVPDARKAKAVSECLEGAVSPLHPSSILQTHPATTVYLDRDSAALLKKGAAGQGGRR